jgi:hypothetical protein
VLFFLIRPRSFTRFSFHNPINTDFFINNIKIRNNNYNPMIRNHQSNKSALSKKNIDILFSNKSFARRSGSAPH